MRYIFVSILLSQISTISYAGSTLDGILGSKKITIATNLNYPPQSSIIQIMRDDGTLSRLSTKMRQVKNPLTWRTDTYITF